MIIRYRPAAVEDIRRTAEYLTAQLKNPSAAARLKKKLLHSISLLKEHPYLGRRLSEKLDGMQTEARFLVVESQLVFYEVDDAAIEVIRVLDGRTDYLARLFSDIE